MSLINQLVHIRKFCMLGFNDRLIKELETQKMELEARQCYTVDTSKEYYHVIGRRYDSNIVQAIADLSMRIDELKRQENARRKLIYQTILDLQRDTELTAKDTFCIFMLHTRIFSREEIAEQQRISRFEQCAIEAHAVPIIYDYLVQHNFIVEDENTAEIGNTLATKKVIDDINEG